MNKLRKIVSGLLLAAVLGAPVSLSARSSSRRSHKANSMPKTVHVRSYTKKNGTHVKAHNRAASQP